MSDYNKPNLIAAIINLMAVILMVSILGALLFGWGYFVIRLTINLVDNIL